MNKNKNKDEGQNNQGIPADKETPEQTIKRLMYNIEKDKHIIEKLSDDLKTANEANIVLSQNFSAIEGKQKKGESIIKALRTELKEISEVMDKQGDAPSAPESEVAPLDRDPGTLDASCAICKTKFSSAATVIKDKESRTYLSLKCPQCGKIQNAEAAQSRFK